VITRSVASSSTCDQLLDQCAVTVDKQKITINKQEKVIKSQDKLIEAQDNEILRSHEETNDAILGGFSVSSVLLLLLLL
jgi:hypothetical protein